MPYLNSMVQNSTALDQHVNFDDFVELIGVAVIDGENYDRH